MSFRFDIPGVYWVPGKLLRGRLINGDTMAGVAEIALDETSMAGGVSLYSKTSTISNPIDSVAAPYFRQVRQVTAQTTVSFDDTTTAQGVIPPTEFAYLSGGFALPALPAGSLQVHPFLVDSGTLQAGGSTAFTLAATGPSSGDLVGMLLWITGGAGSNQAHLIADYNPATLSGHVDRGFTNLTNNTSQYKVLASDLPSVNASGQVKATAIVSGNGDTPVDHNTGGADNLRWANGGVGVDAADVRAFLATDYAAGNTSQAFVKGETVTGPVGGVSGRMLRSMKLDSGNTYTIEWSAIGRFQTYTTNITI